MSKSNTAETNLLKLLMNNTDWANFGDASGLQGSATAGSLYLSLHTADPGEAGDQTTNEISYTGYARKAVARSAAEIDVADGVAELINDHDFPKMTGGTGGTVTHFAIGTQVSGAGEIVYSGTVTPNQAIADGSIPRIEGQASGTASSVTED